MDNCNSLNFYKYLYANSDLIEKILRENKEFDNPLNNAIRKKIDIEIEKQRKNAEKNMENSNNEIKDEI